MIELNYHIPLPADRVWENLTGASHIGKWWGEGVTLEPVKRGQIIKPIVDRAGVSRVITGSITAFDPARRLQFDFRQQDWPKPTRVEFLLDPTADGTGTVLSLMHSGWDAMADETARVRVVDEALADWTQTMKRFIAYCADNRK